MFNLSNKKRIHEDELKNIKEYAAIQLPKNVEEGHTDLSICITEDYSLLDDAYLASIYKGLEKNMAPLIQISDEFTVGESGDAYIESQMEVLRSKHTQEVAMHELSGKNIVKAQQVRMQELEKKIPTVRKNIEDLQTQVDALKDKHAKHAIHIGNAVIQLGLPVTLAAFVADFFVNTEFVQSILYSDVNMLRILVICLCLMSDGTMLALGTLVSQKSGDMPKWLYKTFFAAFVTLFVVSVVGSITIRVGSMPLTYGTFDASGNFVGKENFTIAEYALAIISSLATAVTGALSFFFSVDEDYYLEKECLKLKKELRASEEIYSQMSAEYESLRLTEDPMKCDRDRRKAAEQILENLQEGLKMHMRKMLAIQQKDASYSDTMAASARNLLDNIQVKQRTDAVWRDSGADTKRNKMFRETKDYSYLEEGYLVKGDAVSPLEGHGALFNELFSWYSIILANSVLGMKASDDLKKNLSRNLKRLIGYFTDDEAQKVISELQVYAEASELIDWDGKVRFRTPALDYLYDLLPITKIEVCWLMTILEDPLAQIFLSCEEIQAMKDQLNGAPFQTKKFQIDSINYFDRYRLENRSISGRKHIAQEGRVSDKDLANIHMIYEAIQHGHKVHIFFKNWEGMELDVVCAPARIEYSRRDDTFRMWYVEEIESQIRIINVPRIIEVQELPDEGVNLEEQRKILDELVEETVTNIKIEFYQGDRNLPDRILTEFSLWKKKCVYDVSSGKYTMTLYYSKLDEKEILIRLLSYGPYIRIIASDDNYVLSEIKERIKKQRQIIQDREFELG